MGGAPTAADRSLVVLPFTDLSPDADTRLVSDGQSDELIADLSRMKALRVISGATAMALGAAAAHGSRSPLAPAVRNGFTDVAFLARHNPMLAPLCNEARLQRLMEECRTAAGRTPSRTPPLLVRREASQ